MPYSDSTEYAKYLKKKCEESSEDCGCNDCNEDCGCCPPGLVAVEDNLGENVACLTPNDAEMYYKNTYKCSEGFIKAFDLAGNFVGCLSADDYVTYIGTLTP